MESFTLQTELAWPRKPLFNYLADIENNIEWQSQVVDSLWIVKKSGRIESLWKEVWLVKNEEWVVRHRESLFAPYARRAVISSSQRFRMDMIYNFADADNSTLLKLEVRLLTSPEHADLSEWLRMTWIENLSRLKAVVEADNAIEQAGSVKFAASGNEIAQTL